ncbi:hypothetical protein NDK43_22650 [Neobacillus pocheonensis]|uniref:Uncharacterized protein n=1 Tax=Neobacillus pocheonensis TaxID=363869 RepID=A0ABT0WE80_9BACI|nr:hypothetical protein [Neobacillus pocheonensis]
MKLENKQVLSGFIHDDRFELNHYLTYLFNQFKNSQKYKTLDANQWMKTISESKLEKGKYEEI